MKKTIGILVLTAIALTGCGTSSGSSASADVSKQINETDPATQSTKKEETQKAAKETESVETENPTFRNTVWGMSKDQVIKAEGSKPIQQNESVLLYEDTISGLDVVAYYNFVQDQLVSGAYILKESYMNENQYISDYDKLQDSLSEKYGTPTRDEELWSDDLYQDEPRSNWGMALATGDLKMISMWKTQDTDVSLFLAGENFETNLTILYTGLKYEDLKEKEDKEKDEGKL